MIHRQQLNILHYTVHKRLDGISFAQSAGGMHVSVHSRSIGPGHGFLEYGGQTGCLVFAVLQGGLYRAIKCLVGVGGFQVFLRTLKRLLDKREPFRIVPEGFGETRRIGSGSANPDSGINNGDDARDDA
jgi:hypothetical protein